MVRGVSYGGTIYPVTGFSAQYNRNLITEQGMGLGGEPSVYDGANIVTGTVDALYREEFAPIAQAILDMLSGSTPTISTKTMVASDEYGGLSFPLSFINSFELSVQAKAQATSTMNWISTGPGTSSTVETAATYTNPTPMFWACALEIDSSIVKSTGFTVRLEVPIDQDYYVIGNKYLDGVVQSGNGSLTGSLSFGPKEWSNLQAAMGSCGDIGTISLTLNGQSASDCFTSLLRSIEIVDAVASDSTFNGQNRTKFTKSLNWRAPVTSTKNNDLFS